MSLPDITEQLITSLSTIKFAEYKGTKQLDINKGTLRSKSFNNLEVQHARGAYGSRAFHPSGSH